YPTVPPYIMNPIKAGISDKSTVREGGINGIGNCRSSSTNEIAASILMMINFLIRFISIYIPLFHTVIFRQGDFKNGPHAVFAFQIYRSPMSFYNRRNDIKA